MKCKGMCDEGCCPMSPCGNKPMREWLYCHHHIWQESGSESRQRRKKHGEHFYDYTLARARGALVKGLVAPLRAEPNTLAGP